MRTYLILKDLANSKDYIPMSFFVNKLNVSKRTIQNELSYLKKEGKSNGYEIRNTYGKGYSLEVLNVQDLNHFLSSLNSNASTNVQGKLIYEELSTLLTTNGSQYTPVSELSEKLGLSNTSLYTRLDTISEYLNSYSLKLERKSHYGIKIVGEPKSIRKLMIDLYMHGDNSFVKLIDGCVGNYDEYERIVQDSIRKNDMRIGYYEFQVIMCWLRVIVYYKLFYSKEETSSRSFGLDDDNDFSEFGDVLLSIQHNFQFVLDIKEVQEFYHLVDHSIQGNKINSKIDKEELMSKLIVFFKKIDKENGTNYSGDKFFLENLVTHLEFLIARLNEKVTYKNPLLLELCIRYSMIFDIVLKLSSFLKENFGYETSNDELGLIAVHFLNHSEKEKKNQINKYERVAIVCSTDGGIGRFVQTRIQSIFPNSVTKTFPFWESSNLAFFKPNIIFSSVPMKNNFDCPIVYISELLSDKDLENIKQMLFLDGKFDQRDKYSENSIEYIKLIKRDLFNVVECDSYMELINDMSLRMMKNGYAYKGFNKDVALREKYMSTVYKNGIAIPHPIEMDGRKSAISIYIVKPKLNENKKDIKLVFMICLTKKEFYYYRSISNGLFKLMQNESKINELYSKSDFDITRNILGEMGES